MFSLATLGARTAPQHVLCLGAHCDDLEIGCGGTVARLLAQGALRSVTWVVFSSDERRAVEALHSTHTLLAGAEKPTVLVKTFRDGFFPYHGAEIKDYFEELKATVRPDLVFTHYREDRHQDHRLISDLTWNTFRAQTILEYEIPKYDGDMGSPNVFVELSEAQSRTKIAHLLRSFKSQHDKPWFTAEVFWALLRLRGMECAAASGYAEGFYGRKLVIREAPEA
jgi:LmbE family N-acetylglucosaminyl deacetylase